MNRTVFNLFLLGVILIVNPSIVFAQSFSGKILDRYDKSPIANVIVRNMRTNEIVYSDVKGIFKVQARNGDSILFVSSGYYPFVTTQQKELSEQVEIALERKLLSILEVEVKPDWTPYQRDSIARRSIYKGVLEQQKTTSIFSPISSLADRISRKSRRKWKFQQNFQKWEEEKYQATKYSPQEVNELTALTGDTLATFMNAYPIPDDFARNASDIEIKMWIKNNYREWKEKPFALERKVIQEPTVLSKKELRKQKRLERKVERRRLKKLRKSQNG